MEVADNRACVHHWLLGAPKDDIVRGRCKRCGATRSYPASVEGISRQGIYDEAASLGGSSRLAPDIGIGSGLPRRDRSW
jgi:hypothetical protein